MIRAIIKVKEGCRISGFDAERLITVDFEAQELEGAMCSGTSETGYQIHELVGVEVRPNETPEKE